MLVGIDQGLRGRNMVNIRNPLTSTTLLVQA